MHCSTAREIWYSLESAYGMKTANVKLELMTELSSFKCKSAKDVPLAANKIIGIKNKLTVLGTQIDDTLVISSIVKALPDSMKTFLEFWYILDVEQQNLERFMTKLTEKAKAIAALEDEGISESAKLAIGLNRSGGKGRSGRRSGRSNRRSRPSPQFNPVQVQAPRLPMGNRPYLSAPRPQMQFNRGQSGYTRPPMPRFQPRQPQVQHYGGQPPRLQWNRPTEASPSLQCHYCKEAGHYKSACPKLKAKLEGESFNESYNFGHQAKMAVVEQTLQQQLGTRNMKDSTWTVDSGCSSHMTRHRVWMNQYSEFNTPVRIKLGDDRIVYARGSGCISTTFGTLKDVLHVPDLHFHPFFGMQTTRCAPNPHKSRDAVPLADFARAASVQSARNLARHANSERYSLPYPRLPRRRVDRPGKLRSAPPIQRFISKSQGMITWNTRYNVELARGYFRVHELATLKST